MDNIRYLIVEDESLAADMLRELMSIVRPGYVNIGVTDSVEKSVDFLRSCKPDLILMDIELVDGNCFEIFRKTEIDSPVIFTTAYNEYAVEAFRNKGIDYLLKPIEEKDMAAALDKFEKISKEVSAVRRNNMEVATLTGIGSTGSADSPNGHDMISDAVYFDIDNGNIYMYNHRGRRFIIDMALERLEERLAGYGFVKVSGKYLVNTSAISGIRRKFPYRPRLIVNLDTQIEIPVTISDYDRLKAIIAACR